MRVLCTSVLSPSHTREALRFARLLSGAGHEVHIATEEYLLGFYLDQGVSATACLPSLFADAMTAGQETRDAVRHLQTGTASRGSAALALAGPHMAGQFNALEAVAHDFKPDLLLRDAMDVSACLVAERLGIPQVAMVSGAKGFTDPTALLPHLNRWRSTVGLPEHDDPMSLTPHGHLDDLPPSWTFAPHLPPALAYRRPVIADPRAKLPSWMVGLPIDRPLVYAGIGCALPLFLPSPDGHQPLPGQLDPATVLRSMIEGLSWLDCTAVVSTSGVSVAGLDPAPHVHVVDSVPQPLLLEAADLFLTHGGYTSVWESISTATPMAVLPRTADQPMNARRVTELGLGSEVTDPTPSGIASTCRRLLDDGSVLRRVRQARLACLALPTVETAVDDLESLVNHHTAPQ
ncbi:glycosyltransferase family 1 protein [Streptomyces sp. ISL-96]|uniref:glycosyltransferase n=1 Tax=Streptomyces sp. ISL-96 TaxID=2819191 RepID=UPI001BECA3F4|nr:glycosyltransferase [Streptomyces sp. ISL-96]MBT2490804.1 glycosyltransferase family 1 protein [Streptomyces sp. ISL-96]